MHVDNYAPVNNLLTDNRIIQKNNVTHRQKCMHWLDHNFFKKAWTADNRWLRLGWQKEHKTKHKEKYITGNKYFWPSLSESNSSEELSNYFIIHPEEPNHPYIQVNVDFWEANTEQDVTPRFHRKTDLKMVQHAHQTHDKCKRVLSDGSALLLKTLPKHLCNHNAVPSTQAFAGAAVHSFNNFPISSLSTAISSRCYRHQHTIQ